MCKSKHKSLQAIGTQEVKTATGTKSKLRKHNQINGSENFIVCAKSKGKHIRKKI